jgi:hypothetical protein
MAKKQSIKKRAGDEPKKSSLRQLMDDITIKFGKDDTVVIEGIGNAVLRPIINTLVQRLGYNVTMADLHAKFVKTTSIPISRSLFNEWMKELGIGTVQTVSGLGEEETAPKEGNADGEENDD